MANLVYHWAYMQARMAKAQAEGFASLKRHGTTYSYRLGCRCDPCSERHSERLRTRRNALRRKPIQ